MATRIQTIKVGIFCIAGLALIVALVAIITIKKREPMETYFITFTESVSGLGKDCPVLYQGVPVGKVEEIRVTKTNDILVKVGIATERVSLREGTIATLNIANLMGGMQVELSGGDPAKPELPVGSFIPSKQSVMANIVEDMPKILEKIAGILAKIDQSIGEVQADRLGSLVRNADDTMKTANVTLQDISTFLRTSRGTMINMEYEVAQTMRDLREAIAQANRIFTRLNEDPSSVFWGRPLPKTTHVR